MLFKILAIGGCIFSIILFFGCALFTLVATNGFDSIKMEGISKTLFPILLYGLPLTIFLAYGVTIIFARNNLSNGKSATLPIITFLVYSLILLPVIIIGSLYIIQRVNTDEEKIAENNKRFSNENKSKQMEKIRDEFGEVYTRYNSTPKLCVDLRFYAVIPGNEDCKKAKLKETIDSNYVLYLDSVPPKYTTEVNAEIYINPDFSDGNIRYFDVNNREVVLKYR